MRPFREELCGNPVTWAGIVLSAWDIDFAVSNACSGRSQAELEVCEALHMGTAYKPDTMATQQFLESISAADDATSRQCGTTAPEIHCCTFICPLWTEVPVSSFASQDRVIRYNLL